MKARTRGEAQTRVRYAGAKEFAKLRVFCDFVPYTKARKAHNLANSFLSTLIEITRDFR